MRTRLFSDGHCIFVGADFWTGTRQLIETRRIQPQPGDGGYFDADEVIHAIAEARKKLQTQIDNLK